MQFKTEKDAGIATISFCQPDKMNPLSVDGLREFGEAVTALGADDDVRAIIVTGEGRAFCVGADLSSLLEYIREDGSDMVSRPAMEKVFDEAVNFMAQAIHDCEKPMIAAVNGVAAGGGVGIALGCDIVLASDKAAFAMPFVPGLGIVPDCGSSWLMTRMIGAGRALPAILLGDPIPAAKAAEWGMVWDVLSGKDLIPAAQKMAAKLAAGPIPTYSDVRAAVASATTQSFADHLQQERNANSDLATMSNFTEGVSAFIEKRRPVYSAKRD